MCEIGCAARGSHVPQDDLCQLPQYQHRCDPTVKTVNFTDKRDGPKEINRHFTLFDSKVISFVFQPKADQGRS